MLVVVVLELRVEVELVVLEDGRPVKGRSLGARICSAGVVSTLRVIGVQNLESCKAERREQDTEMCGPSISIRRCTS